jgi:glucose-6-phosphate dehydrogenase assembly protein OpcA
MEEAVTATPAAAPWLERTAVQRTTIRRIPDALRDLWRACCPETPGGDVARALTVNFLGLAPVGDEAALREAVQRLLRRTPCRAFLLLLDPDSHEANAEVAAASRGKGSNRDIVLEEITVRMPPGWLSHVPGLVRPLLENDLPNHLWWSTRWPGDERTFDDLARLCDHSVVDSRRFGDPARELGRVQSLRTTGRRITDLQWLRLRPWRRALALAFERLPWRPGTAVRARLRHGPQGAAAALLLAEWLQARLDAHTRFELSTATDAADDLDLVVVDLDGFEVELLAQGARVTAHVTTPERCFLPFHVPTSRGGDGDLLAAAIDIA